MNPAAPLLTKSRFMRAGQCSKALWLDINQPAAKTEIDEQTRYRFEMGEEINFLARTLYDDGKMVTAKDIEHSILQTESYVQDGNTVIYEAAARSDSCYARIDILRYLSGSESWQLIEVKSTNSAKEQHTEDLTFQHYVFTKAGYNVTSCILLHLNKEYRRNGEINPKQLFKAVDVTEEVNELQADIAEEAKDALSVMTMQTMPKYDIGGQCNSPYECGNKDDCWADVPEYSLFNLFNADKAVALAEKSSSYAVEGLPKADWPSGVKQTDLQAYLNDEPHINHAEIVKFLAEFQYPLIYLDYETIMPPLPLFDGLGTYAMMPFQFSAYTETKRGAEITHRQYLHWQHTDPREEFIEALLDACGTKGSIIVYHAPFERSRNNELAKQFPKYADALHAINERMIDLLIPFKKRWLYHPKQKGSASIKAVLPAFTNLTYQELDVANGADASHQYLMFHAGRLTTEESEKLYADLTAYCELDTWAMKELVGVLRNTIT